MKLIDDIKKKYSDWKESRFLKKHHCDTREQYERRYDPDVCHQTLSIKNFYHGYKHVYCIEPRGHHAYKLLYDYGPGGYRYGYDDILDWCKQHCVDKYRADIHRVMRDNWSDDWHINELGGGDYVFFAFKNEKDYMLFLLRWS